MDVSTLQCSCSPCSSCWNFFGNRAPAGPWCRMISKRLVHVLFEVELHQKGSAYGFRRQQSWDYSIPETRPGTKGKPSVVFTGFDPVRYRRESVLSHLSLLPCEYFALIRHFGSAVLCPTLDSVRNQQCSLTLRYAERGSRRCTVIHGPLTKEEVYSRALVRPPQLKP